LLPRAETISTLKFASRAKSIQNKPIINEILSSDVQIKRYKQQIDELERRLSEVWVLPTV
jgi:centromeric protein E